MRLLLALTVALVAAAPAAAGAAEWPLDRQFTLVEPPNELNLAPPPSGLAELGDGTLLALLYWPIVEEDETGTSEKPRTRLVRLAPGGARSFVTPFPRDARDELLPLPDGSILVTRFNAIDRRKPDGALVPFAGTGRYNEASSGDGGPATQAEIGFAAGLSRLADGSVVFADRDRIRRVAPDGTITTIAGAGGEFDGPQDVLPTADGGLLVADTYNGLVRRVDAQGVVTTVAGTGEGDLFDSSGDGGPATAAQLALPAHLGVLPDGSVLVGEAQRIRRVAPDGTISTLFDPATVRGGRAGDFAGRFANTVEAMEVTREGGVAVIVGGVRLTTVYLAPAETDRTLVALRAARVSAKRVAVGVDASRGGRLRLELRRGGEVVARASRTVEAGRRALAVRGRFAAGFHDVRVSLRGKVQDEVEVFTSSKLPKRLVTDLVGDDVERCKRLSGRRIDCEVHDPESEEDGVACLGTTAYRLFRSGILFRRPYGERCHPAPQPFEAAPGFTGPWVSAWLRR